MLTVWTMQPFTLLDVFSSAFLRYDVMNVNSYMVFFIIASRPLKTFKARMLTFPHLRQLLLTPTVKFLFF